MSISISSTDEIEINLLPGTVEEEVMQNIWFILSSLEFDCPLERELGLNGSFIDKPIEVSKALLTADIYDKVEKFEPRAEIVEISFDIDYDTGKITPTVEVEIDGEYDNEEYTE